jgi:hypothetical protein
VGGWGVRSRELRGPPSNHFSCAAGEDVSRLGNWKEDWNNGRTTLPKRRSCLGRAALSRRHFAQRSVAVPTWICSTADGRVLRSPGATRQCRSSNPPHGRRVHAGSHGQSHRCYPTSGSVAGTGRGSARRWRTAERDDERLPHPYGRSVNAPFRLHD